jgi:hypothetical protein
MAVSAYNAGNQANDSLKTIWDAEFGLEPTEETKIADWVANPIGAQKFGNILKLRKIPTVAGLTYTPTTTAGLRANLTGNTSAGVTVSATATSRYSMVSMDRSILNQVVDDGNLRNGFKRQMSAGIDEEVDLALFTLAASLSGSVSQADIDDAMVRTALGQLATAAKGKFNSTSAKLLVVHPSELKNVWNIPAIKEYQIRGTIGAAVNAQMNAYGLIWRESGKVYQNLGSTYNPLLLKDAWALAWNEKPHILDVQYDGLVENYVAYTEFGVCEWFDSSGQALVTT